MTIYISTVVWIVIQLCTKNYMPKSIDFLMRLFDFVGSLQKNKVWFFWDKA